MTTNIKSESIMCHIWNTTILLTEKSCAKLPLKGKKNQKKPAGVPGTFFNNEIQFGDQLMGQKFRKNFRYRFMNEGTEILRGNMVRIWSRGIA